MINIYTDGSCHPLTRTGAWAAIVLAEEQEILLSGQVSGTTHQRMELTAAIEALRHLQKLGMTVGEIVVYTDSQYLAGIAGRRSALMTAGLVTRKQQPMRNSDLILEIFGWMNHFRLTWLKIPSHQKAVGKPDVYYNRAVDRCSRKIVRDFVRNARLKPE